MYILCLLHPFTPLLCTHCSHITHQHRETLHIQDYSHKEHHKSDHISIKWSSLTHLTYFFWLFRDLDLKSHSITCQGYASPIYYNLHLLSLMAHPSWPACSAKLNGNSLIKDKYFWKSLSEWLHTCISSTIHWRTAPGGRVAAQKQLRPSDVLQHPTCFFLMVQHLVCCLLKTSNSR